MFAPSLGRNGALAIGLTAVAAVFLATTGNIYGNAFAQVIPSPPLLPQQGNLEHTILVSGTASAKAIPDRAIVIFAVETRDATAGAALAKNSQAMNNVLDALKEVGVQKNETSTAYFNIFPIYNYTQSGNVQSLQGYTVTNSLTVSSANTGNVSSWIDAAVHAGANRVDNVQFVFSSEKMAKIQSDLIENAIGNARAKADTIAAKLGVQITGVQNIISIDSAPVPGLSFTAPSLGPTGTPIVVGGQEVSASVSIAYTIR
ncbi:MAG TPA: SIMPL domain-containing protein [Nitrososphaera sp.]|jgi:uncharacterized protein YggE|nr:SIMPL domain-containing protein [Nitrososphaera sp.]